MIKKLKENFLILLISNMLTIVMVVVAPRIHGAIANLMVTVLYVKKLSPLGWLN